MGLGIGEIANMVGGLFGLVDKAIEDKDKKNELKGKLVELQTNVSLAVIDMEKEKTRLEAEITKATIQSDLPKWARLTYLFGRQLYSALIVIVIAGFAAVGKPLPADVIMWMIAPGAIYNGVKGKGNSSS